MSNVRKIRSSWELAAEDEEGNLVFAFTDRPLRDLEEMQRASEKVLKEMESRRKL